jgi:hypothetical protein
VLSAGSGSTVLIMFVTWQLHSEYQMAAVCLPTGRQAAALLL